MNVRGALVLLVVLGLLAAGCGPAVPSATPTGAGSGASATEAAAGPPIGELGNLDAEDLRRALLGQPPYPSGWEAEVDELVTRADQLLNTLRLPDVAGLDSTAASCAAWSPLVGNTHWANGAFVERQLFVAHVALLVRVVPPELRPAAEEAHRIAAAAAAEQMRAGGDAAIVGRFPEEAVRSIGLWAVEHCDLPVQALTPKSPEAMTDGEIATACSDDRHRLEDAMEAYRIGPGGGRYPIHPHAMEVTLAGFAYPAWHGITAVDNAADPPSFAIEPISGGMCDQGHE